MIRRKWIIPICIVMLTALLYGHYLWNPIVFDDIYFFIDNHQSIDNYANNFNILEIRWLPYATIALVEKWFGLNLINFRITGILLHSSVAIALFLMLKELYLLPIFKLTNENTKKQLVYFSFLAACLFTVHPVAVYAAGYLIQRTIVMAALFSFLSTYMYLLSLRSKPAVYLLLSILFYLLAVLSKENAIMLPAIMLMITYITSTRLFTDNLRLSYFGMAGVIACYVAIQKLGLLGTVYEIDAAPMLEATGIGHPMISSIMGQCTFFFKYLALWIFPNPAWMSVDMREPFATNIWSIQLLGVVAFIVYGLIAVKLISNRNKTSLLGIAMIFPWLLFFTEFSVVRIQEPFVLYRSYLWMPGILIGMPLIWQKLSSKMFKSMGVFLILIFSVISNNRLQTFSHPLLLWEDAQILLGENLNLPGTDRIYYNLGLEYYNIKTYEKAELYLETAVKLRPGYSPYYLALGATYLKSDQYENAIQLFNKVIATNKNEVKAYQGLGLSYLKLKNIDAAKNYFSQACNMNWKAACHELKNLEK